MRISVTYYLHWLRMSVKYYLHRREPVLYTISTVDNLCYILSPLFESLCYILSPLVENPCYIQYCLYWLRTAVIFCLQKAKNCPVFSPNNNFKVGPTGFPNLRHLEGVKTTVKQQNEGWLICVYRVQQLCYTITSTIHIQSHTTSCRRL